MGKGLSEGLRIRAISAAGQDRDAVRVVREAGFEAQPEFDPGKPTFIDETGLNTRTGRSRGRDPRSGGCP